MAIPKQVTSEQKSVTKIHTQGSVMAAFVVREKNK